MGSRNRKGSPSTGSKRADLSEAERLLGTRLRSAHHLDGAVTLTAAGHPAVAFQLSHGVFEAPFDARRARLGTLGIRHNLGVGLALALRDESQILALAWLAPDGPEASALIAKQELRVVCFRRHRVEHQSVFVFDELPVLEDLRQEAIESGVMPTLAYWRALSSADSVEHLLTPNDRAARASARVWDDRIEGLREELPALVAHAKEARPTHFTPPYAQAIEILRDRPAPLASLVALAVAEVEHDLGRRLVTRGDTSDLADLLRSTMVSFALDCPTATQNGRAMTSVALTAPDEGGIVRIPLDLDEISRRISVDEYWERMPSGFRVHWDKFLRPNDIPVSIDALQTGLGEVPLVEDVDATIQLADALLEEASRMRRWTIPPRAVVELRFAPFVRAEVLDLGSIVIFVCRTARWEFYPILVSLSGGHVMHGLDSLVNPEAASRLDATLRLVLAAIVRDFLVLETRTTAFACVAEQPHPPREAAPGREIVVYLPRVRYEGRPDRKRIETMLASSLRRAHQVAPHLRRSSTMSTMQRAIAELHNWTIPVGFTFVRQHQRGGAERDAVYRSRSALQTLWETNDAADELVGADWFSFEASVREVLSSRGLTVEKSSSLSNEDGVQIYASSASHEEALWLVHALFIPRVGQHAVNRLAMARGQAPPSTRALLVTSGMTTSAAEADAASKEIVIVKLHSAKP